MSIKPIYFGTDGIRGKVNGSVINSDFLENFGFSVGKYLVDKMASCDFGFLENFHKNRLVVAIGMDTRNSGVFLSDALINGLMHWPIEIHFLGIVPTPCLAKYVKKNGCSFGIVLTASHNPFTDNGIKIFKSDAKKLTVSEEIFLEKYILDSLNKKNDRPKELIGSKILVSDAIDKYLLSEKNAFPCEFIEKIKKTKIVLDCANGANCLTSPKILTELGCEIVCVGIEPDGMNINKNCGSEHSQLLSDLVIKNNADIGIAHDGDGDRVIFCDENGLVLTGEEVLGIFAIYSKIKEASEKNSKFCRDNFKSYEKIVTTIQSNFGLKKSLSLLGIDVQICDVGDRSVFYKMCDCDAYLGGESSGHFIFRDISNTGDGLFAAIKMLEIFIRTKKKLSELRKSVLLFPKIEKNYVVNEKIPINELPELKNAILKIENEIKNGRVLVRYSGTELVLRVLIESESESENFFHIRNIENAILSSKITKKIF